MPEIFFLIVFYTCALALTALVIYALRFEYRLQNPFFLVWLAILAIYVLPSFFDPFYERAQVNPFGPVLDLRSNITLIRAEIFAIGFTGIYLLVRLALARPEQALKRSMINFEKLPQALLDSKDIHLITTLIFLGLVTAFVLALLAIVSTQGISGLLTATYSSYRDDSNTVLKLTSYYLLIGVSGVVFIAWATNRKKLLLMSLALIMSIFLFGKTRQLLIPALVPFMLYLVYVLKGTKGKLWIILAVFSLYAGNILLQILRYQGDLSSGLGALASGDFYLAALQALAEGKGEAVRRLQYYYFLQPGVGFEGFGEGLTYRRLSLILVPGFFFGDIKPIDTDILAFEAYFGYGISEGYSIHTLIYGSAFINFAWWGIFIGVFWALLAYGFTRLQAMVTPVHRVLMIPIMGYAVLMISRGSTYNSLTMWIWTTAFTFVVMALVNDLSKALKGAPQGTRTAMDSTA